MEEVEEGWVVLLKYIDDNKNDCCSFFEKCDTGFDRNESRILIRKLI